MSVEYRSSPAFTSHVTRTSPQEPRSRLLNLKWHNIADAPDSAYGQCYSTDHMDYVRQLLTEQRIPVIGEDKTALTVTVSKSDLVGKFPNILDGQQL